MNAAKKTVLTLTMLSVLFAGIAPAGAQDWYYQSYQSAYPVQPVGYPQPYQPYPQQNHEVLKKVLVGGALIGIGFLAGRLTAPKQNYGYGYAPQGPQWNQPAYYHGSHGHHGHRF